MKNLIRKCYLLCVATFALAFTACGKSDKPEPDAVEEEDTAKDEAEEPEEPAAENEEDASDLLLPANMQPSRILSILI